MGIDSWEFFFRFVVASLRLPTHLFLAMAVPSSCALIRQKKREGTHPGILDERVSEQAPSKSRSFNVGSQIRVVGCI